MRQIVLFSLLVFFLAACRNPAPQSDANDADTQGHTSPTEATVRINAEFAKKLDLENPGDFQTATQGLVGQDPDLRVKSRSGEVIWDMPAYGFIEGPAPSSVNPSLWRQARLNNIHGLFKVTDGIYQVRGHDLANM
ncbi:MAG: hypothetical protein HUN04_07465 [Desulfobacter sp.]|nr:MAG: hypothetical protein HUN04_07465 [Desulfobacter sp.]